MIVSVDTRLASMISALGGAVLPAVGDNAFVTEQAQLVVGHLQVLRAQGEYSEEYEVLEHRYLRRLATDVAEHAEGGPRTTAVGIRPATVTACPARTSLPSTTCRWPVERPERADGECYRPPDADLGRPRRG